jgi:hydroxyethylthiazole kinase-like uncharacterized protein yjeF
MALWSPVWPPRKAGASLSCPRPIPPKTAARPASVSTGCPSISAPRAKASIQEIEEALAEADLIVDALLGTGSHGPARADTARMIETINAVSERKNIPVVAVDIPSGLPSDAGWKGEGPVVRATLTIAIGGPKLGEIVEPGASRTGRLEIAPIGFPADLLYAKKIQGHLMTADYVASLLPDRASDAHKGTFGRCLIVAGSMGLGGAAALAALGALRGGAGLIHAAVPEAIYPAVLPVAPEAIFHPLGGPGSRFFRGEDASELSGADWFGSIDAAVLGPGLGGREETVSFAKRVLDSFEKPLILDADALAALKSFGRLPDRRAEVVGIVPHPGEMARLMDKSVADIQKDRIGCAREAAKRFNCHVLLKGARTVIAEPCGRYFINPTGNTGLAKGGSGDVLAGLIGALLAQGMTIADALRAGAYLHGLAADLLAERPDASVRSILPTEVAAHLGAAFRTVEKARE